MMSSKLTSLFKHEKPTNTTEAVKRPSTRTGSKRKGDGESSTDAQIRSQGEAAVTNIDVTPEERILRAFDLKSKFGPCVGMTRLERWERATKLGLAPPAEVKELIMAQGGPGSAADSNIWHNRV